MAQRQKRKCKLDIPIALNKLLLSCENQALVAVNRGADHCTISDYRAVWLN